jgi:O-antigen/teichoic acid export membrane protein
MRTGINIISSYARFLTGMLVILMLTPFTLELVGIDDFGLWSLCLAVTGMLALLDMGFSTATVKYVAECKGSENLQARNEAVSTLIALYAALGLLCLVIVVQGIPYAISVFDLDAKQAEKFNIVMMISGAALAVALPIGVFRSLLIGSGRYDIVNIVEIAGVLINAGLVVLLLTSNLGVTGLAIANAGVLVGVPVMLAPLAYRYIPGLSLSIRHIRVNRIAELLPLSFYFMLANIAMLVILRSDSMIIKGFLSLSAVAAFAIAARIAEYAYLLNKQFSNALMPLVSQSNGSGDAQTVRLILLDGTRHLAAIAAMITGLLFFHAESLIVLWVGEQMIDAVLPFQILIAAVFFSALQLNAANVLGMSGGHRGVAWTMLGSASLNLVLSVTLIPIYGLAGAALATLFSAMVVELSIILPRACRQQGIVVSQVIRNIIPALICALPMLWLAKTMQVLYTPDNLLELALQCAVAALVFVVFYFFIGLRTHEKKTIARGLRSSVARLRMRAAYNEGGGHG